MKCPFCGSQLVKGYHKRFTNTAEHAFDPNGEFERPLRITYVCESSCHLSQGGFWDSQGGRYGGDVSYKEIHEWKMKQGRDPFSDLTAAVGSWDEWYCNKTEFSHKIQKLLFFVSGNKKYSISYRISSFIFGFFEPEYAIE